MMFFWILLNLAEEYFTTLKRLVLLKNSLGRKNPFDKPKKESKKEHFNPLRQMTSTTVSRHGVTSCLSYFPRFPM
jgi:hypothetical protein